MAQKTNQVKIEDVMNNENEPAKTTEAEIKNNKPEVEEKADNCRSRYYEDEKISSNDSGSSSDNIADDLNITVNLKLCLL